MWTSILTALYCVLYAVISDAKQIIVDDVETSTSSFDSDFLPFYDPTDYSKKLVESDANHDGKLTFDEFVKKPIDDIVAEKNVIFQKIDSNGNGLATQTEVDDYSASLKAAYIAYRLSTYDKYLDGNKDNKLQVEEFLRYTPIECYDRDYSGDGEIAEDGLYISLPEYFSKWDKDGDQSWNAEGAFT
uniref:EF-hand domain-containing protein n=1 Tax=Plectus sambesii TaxID=2011161 RepID=A0A914XIV0_9BILA